MILIDGKVVAAFFKSQIAEEVNKMKEQGMKVPHLAAILVGNDGSSETYVAAKVKACELVGFNSSLFRFPDAVSERELIEKINEINYNEDIDGYIVQLPLPKHISGSKIIKG